jgi:hypothetical protein
MPITRSAHLWRYVIAFAMPAALLAVIAMWPGAPSGQAGATVIGVDANPAGNTANSLGSRDACVEVGVGQEFDVDVFIQGASDLKGFDIYFGFNPALVEVRDPAFDQMMITGFDASVLDVNYYFIAVGAASGGPGADGAGVLARMHLRSKAQGISEASVRTVPAPPYLSTTSGAAYHSSPILNAQIAIGQSCAGAPTLPPTPTAPPTLPPTPSPSPTQAPTPTQTPGNGTPTFTPVPGTIPWGDADCRLGVNAEDALAIAAVKAGIPISPIGAPCPNIGDDLIGAPIQVEWGDFNCDGQFNLADSIAIMLYLVGLPASGVDGCPSIATNYVSIP